VRGLKSWRTQFHLLNITWIITEILIFKQITDPPPPSSVRLSDHSGCANFLIFVPSFRGAQGVPKIWTLPQNSERQKGWHKVELHTEAPHPTPTPNCDVIMHNFVTRTSWRPGSLQQCIISTRAHSARNTNEIVAGKVHSKVSGFRPWKDFHSHFHTWHWA